MDIDRKSSGYVLTALSKVILACGGFILGLVLVRIFILPFTVGDDTMLPNFRQGEKLFILRHVAPKAGDVVLIDSPIEDGAVMLKRIIAVEGDTVEMKSRVLHVNGRPGEFGWQTVSRDTRIFPMNFSNRDNYPILKVKRREYFVAGDNLDYAMDSRFFGVITGDKIIGRYLYTIPFFGKR
jgi:signal peptidase I